MKFTDYINEANQLDIEDKHRWLEQAGKKGPKYKTKFGKVVWVGGEWIKGNWNDKKGIWKDGSIYSWKFKKTVPSKVDPNKFYEVEKKASDVQELEKMVNK